ncbi:MAG: AI-2 transport protein TqsA [Chloroflexi bacterium ADurb.Bin325]|nr:MAG: AI-2 transport protein TqsA [Chloroflexi bacterium ADurb.Bin325]
MSTRWNPFFKQLVIVITLVAMVWLVTRTSVILAPVILTLLLAYLVSLPVDRFIRNTGWPRTPVVFITEMVVILLLLTVPAAITPWLINALTSFGNTLVNIVQELLEATPKPISITPSWSIDLGPYYAPINEWLHGLISPDLMNIVSLQSILSSLATGAAGVVRGAINGVFWAFLILVVAFYIVRDGPAIGKAIAEQVPPPWRPELGRLWRELCHIWDAFVRGQLILGVIVGIVVWIAMTILGVRNAPVLGLLSGMLEFVPAIGPFLAAIPGVAIGLFIGSTWLPLPNLWFAILVMGVYITIQQVENLYLLPRIVGRRVRLHPAVIIVGVLAGNELGGILGILLAAPTIAALRVLIGYIFRKLFDMEPFPPEDAERGRAAQWPALVQQTPVRGILFDLDGTLLEIDRERERELARRLAFLSDFLSESQRRRLARRGLLAGELWANRFLGLLARLKLDARAKQWEPALRRFTGTRLRADFATTPGVPDALRILARNYRLAIVTPRSREDVAVFLARCGLRGLFSAIITREDLRRARLAQPAAVVAANRLDIPIGQCVMVADTKQATQSAKRAGALTVGVLCGFGVEGDFEDADLVLSSTAQLRTWL